MGQIFTKQYWDEQGEETKDFFESVYKVGKFIWDENNAFYKTAIYNAITAPSEKIVCGVFGAGCPKKPAQIPAMFGDSGNINYSGYHTIIGPFAHAGPIIQGKIVQPSQVAKISNPYAKIAIATTRGVQRQGLQLAANVSDLQKINQPNNIQKPQANVQLSQQQAA